MAHRKLNAQVQQLLERGQWVELCNGMPTSNIQRQSRLVQSARWYKKEGMYERDDNHRGSQLQQVTPARIVDHDAYDQRLCHVLVNTSRSIWIASMSLEEALQQCQQEKSVRPPTLHWSEVLGDDSLTCNIEKAALQSRQSTHSN